MEGEKKLRNDKRIVSLLAWKAALQLSKPITSSIVYFESEGECYNVFFYYFLILLHIVNTQNWQIRMIDQKLNITPRKKSL